AGRNGRRGDDGAVPQSRPYGESGGDRAGSRHHEPPGQLLGSAGLGCGRDPAGGDSSPTRQVRNLARQPLLVPLDQGLPPASVFVTPTAHRLSPVVAMPPRMLSPDPGFGPSTTRNRASSPRRIRVLLSPLATSWKVPTAQTVSSDAETPQ